MQSEAERIPGRKFSLEGVQILRAIAALIVVLHHSLEESLVAAVPFSPDWLTTFGAAGVDIFFVISGFIMYYVSFPNDGSTTSTTSFLVKRFTRIYPFYWFCIALVLSLWSLGFFRSLQLDTSILVRSILLFPSERLIINVSWTLVYEMYFYLVFAATLIFRKPLVSLLGTSATIIILLGVGRFVPDAALRAFLSNPIALEFCFGLILGYVYQRRPGLASTTRLLWIPGFAFLMIAPLFVPHAGTNGLEGFLRVLAWGIPAFLIVLSSLAMKPGETPFHRVMTLLGDASYAIYLTHPLIMIIYARLLKGSLANLSQIPVIPVVVLLSLGLGLMLHLFVERKLIDMARGLVRNGAALPGLSRQRSPTAP